MRSVTRAPHPALAPFVAALGYGGGEFPHDREVRVPTGCLQLVVNLHEDRLRWYDGPGYRTGHHTTGAALCGATSGPVGIDTADQRRVLWVAFRPGGGYPFFAPPAAELTGPVVPLDALWGAGAGNLRERLLAAPSPAAALAVAEEVLLARATRPLDPDPGLAAALAALDRGVPVGRVADTVGASHRTLTRRFAARVGPGPKRYARIRRVQRVLDRLPPGPAVDWPAVDWAAIAAEHGYFDQAHLINEFRAMTGTTPAAYLPRAPGERNHLPLA